MRNITDILARYLSDINLPSVSIIDIIEIILITFFVYEYDPVDRIKTGQCTDHGDRCNIST